MEAIFSTAYLAPVHYYARLMQYERVFVEQFDTYQKQTYRNRCVILGANGPLSLTVPVVKLNGNKTMVKDIRIDYATRWQNNHWRAIVSSYNSSPFFEYYKDEFAPFYERRWDFLIDFNMELHQLVAENVEIVNAVKPTTGYVHHFDGADYRETITPKPQRALLTDKGFRPVEYSQTFAGTHGFIPNLSIADLLFNRGPETETILQDSIKF
jgi:hypothetical protein